MPDPKGSGSTRREFVGGRLPQRMAVLQTDKLDAVADRGYFNGVEILACDRAGIAAPGALPRCMGVTWASSDVISLSACAVVVPVISSLCRVIFRLGTSAPVIVYLPQPSAA